MPKTVHVNTWVISVTFGFINKQSFPDYQTVFRTVVLETKMILCDFFS